MVFLDPPADNLEHWQQLEQVLELTDHQDSQHSSTPPPSPGYHPSPARTPDEGCHDASSAAASLGGHARQPASRVAGCESTRGIRQQSGSCQHKIEAHMVSRQAPNATLVLRAKKQAVLQLCLAGTAVSLQWLP